MKTKSNMTVKEPIEISKCCRAIPSWNFCFKSCSKCGKKFEPKLSIQSKEK